MDLKFIHWTLFISRLSIQWRNDNTAAAVQLSIIKSIIYLFCIWKKDARECCRPLPWFIVTDLNLDLDKIVHDCPMPIDKNHMLVCQKSVLEQRIVICADEPPKQWIISVILSTKIRWVNEVFMSARARKPSQQSRQLRKRHGWKQLKFKFTHDYSTTQNKRGDDIIAISIFHEAYLIMASRFHR